MKKFIVLIMLFLFCTGCAGLMGNQSSVCTDRVGSPLCDAAEKLGVSLELTGTILIATNLEAISAGAYSKADATNMLDHLISATEPGSYTTQNMLRGIVGKIMVNHPGLFLLSDTFLQAFESPAVIPEWDKDRLNKYFKRQKMMLGN